MNRSDRIPASDRSRATPVVELRRLPIVTISVLIITGVGTALQLIYPGVFPALRRDPAALAAGEWWRMATPLLVNDGDPTSHFALVSAGFVLVGSAAERLLGRVGWLLLFFAGALAGTVAGYGWDPYGAGASIALCGLIGGLAVRQIKHGDLHLVASIYTVGLATALTAEAVTALFSSNTIVGIVSAGLLCWLLINLLNILRRRRTDNRTGTYYVGIVVLLGALALTALRDIHGVALLAGLCLAALMLWRAPYGRYRNP